VTTRQLAAQHPAPGDSLIRGKKDGTGRSRLSTWRWWAPETAYIHTRPAAECVPLSPPAQGRCCSLKAQLGPYACSPPNYPLLPHTQTHTCEGDEDKYPALNEHCREGLLVCDLVFCKGGGRAQNVVLNSGSRLCVTGFGKEGRHEARKPASPAVRWGAPNLRGCGAGKLTGRVLEVWATLSWWGGGAARPC
jgi:hypothetical protein